MPTDDFDSPFRRALGEVPELPGRLDAGSVIRRARRRRRVRQVAVGGVAGLAIVGVIGVLGPNLARVVSASTASSGSASVADGAAQPQDSAGGGSTAVPHSISTDCDSELSVSQAQTYSARNPAGVSASMKLSGPQAEERLGGAITLTSTEESSVGVTAADPTLLFSQSGTVKSVGSLKDVIVAQSASSPGQTQVLSGRVSATACSPAGQKLAAGEYDVIAIIPVTIDGKEEPIYSTPTKVTVR